MKLRSALVFSCVLALMAQLAVGDVGIAGWPIFNKIQSPRAAALAAAAPCWPELAGVLYNPATSARLKNKVLSFLSEIGADQQQLGGVFLSIPAGRGRFTFGGAYYDAGPLELNWMDNGVIHSRNVSAQRDMFGIISYAVPLFHRFWGGLSLKGASSEIAEMSTAQAFVADLGFFYLPVRNFAVSVALQNFGISTKFLAKENPLPFGGYFGTAWCIGSKASYVMPALGAFYNMTDHRLIPQVGIELGAGHVSVNAGYRFTPGEMNMTLGLRLRVGDVAFGYAYVPGEYLDATHRVNVEYRF